MLKNSAGFKWSFACKFPIFLGESERYYVVVSCGVYCVSTFEVLHNLHLRISKL